MKKEELDTILSYKTIESITFSKLFIDWGLDDRNDFNIVLRFGCSRLPTNYEALSALPNLKYLDLKGIKNLNGKIMASIPSSVEKLTLTGIKFTQEMVDALSNLTNLNSLILHTVL